MNNNLFILSGPSGAGEDSIIDGLKKIMPISKVITTTTREMRPGESHGNQYYFISKEEFQKGIEAGRFIEYAIEYNNNYYGVTKEEITRVQNGDRVAIWKIEYKGVMKAKEIFPEIIAIFINAPLETLERRIKLRDDASDAFIKERMDYTKQWLKHKDIYDFEVNNIDGELDESIKKVAEIIKNQVSISKNS